MVIRCLIYTLAWLAVFALVLFGAAGDWRWPQAWVYLAEYFVLAAIMIVWFDRHDPALLRERFSSPVHRDQAPWDRFFLLGIAIVYFGWLALMGLDARRFEWSHVPVALEVLGAIVFAASFLAVLGVLRANTFAVPQVRAQKDRAQTVISDGPYRIVRHPMYAVSLPLFVATPLFLGSWLGLLVVPVIVPALAWRILGEERLLRRELPGYENYARRVCYRLVPGIW